MIFVKARARHRQMADYMAKQSMQEKMMTTDRQALRLDCRYSQDFFDTTCSINALYYFLLVQATQK